MSAAIEAVYSSFTLSTSCSTSGEEGIEGEMSDQHAGASSSSEGILFLLGFPILTLRTPVAPLLRFCRLLPKVARGSPFWVFRSVCLVLMPIQECCH